jgi:(2R)-sulfolactate sulfo-lyase subunit alpha
MAEPSGQPDFLIHDAGDVVGVAVRDLAPGPASGGYLRGDEVVRVDLREAVPLGHKLALADINGGQDIIEYGQRVGLALRDIARGEYVHVHNVRSARWQNSLA